MTVDADQVGSGAIDDRVAVVVDAAAALGVRDAGRGQPVDPDHGAGPIRSGHSGGRRLPAR